jgi:hypothetical protein
MKSSIPATIIDDTTETDHKPPTLQSLSRRRHFVSLLWQGFKKLNPSLISRGGVNEEGAAGSLQKTETAIIAKINLGVNRKRGSPRPSGG